MVNLSENSKKVLTKRYLRKDENGEPAETIEEMFWRVASHIALAEDVTAQEYYSPMFYNLLTELRFFPNSPTFTGAGTPLGQLAACFVLPIADDMGKHPDGIFQTLRNAVLIQQSGGGNGFAFSRVRPKGALVKASMGQATGPIGFLQVYDKAFGVVQQGGTRRCANMGVLRVDHPDIEEFILCKAKEGELANFNISVGITDEFMKAVESDGNFDLRFDGKVYKTVRAKDLFAEIVKYAHKNGEPGVLFLDAANRQNPLPHLYELEATNPCVTGDTLIHTTSGLKTAKELYDSDELLDVIIDGRFGKGKTAKATRVYWTGYKAIFALKTKEGHLLRATYDHSIMTPDGWVELGKLNGGDIIHVLDGLATVESITANGFESVYDLTEPLTNSFIANGIVVHNCGEQYLAGYENCCLGSINLATHIRDDGELDWLLLEQTIKESTHFLDNVVTMNNYVPAIPQLREAAMKSRRIGLGIMGLADAMYAAGIRYGSNQGQEYAANVMEFVRYHCMKTSVELARHRGSFDALEGSIYDPSNFRFSVPESTIGYGDEWTELIESIKTHGIRNSCQTTIAPTGTIATVAGCEGYGCEPVFALAYIRHVNDNGKDLELTYTSPLFEKALAKAGLDEATHKLIIDQVLETGTCQGIAELPEWIRNTFVVSSDITAEEHVKMQASLQKWVDNSISKTCNFPEGATKEDVANAYMMAWKLGCKGLTVYVTGSRNAVVLETKSTKDAKVAVAETVKPVMKERPKVLKGETHRVQTPLGNSYVTINSDGNGDVFEVFAQTSKAGSETAAVSEAIGRLISYVLRLPSPLSTKERLQEVINQLIGIGSGRPMGFGANRVASLPDGVAQVLQAYLNGTEVAQVESKKPLGDICPSCGEAQFVNEEGCRKCYSCAYSEC